tara:strand:+ start:32 stop:712 length:681 start_codon:yes stop_codon:yes gene_type:complete
MAEYQTLHKFVPRATRFVLRPEDNRLLLYKPQPRLAPTHSTEILNISATGVAFVTERDIAPKLGEIIKMEFTIPGGEKIAWFGRVVRTEEFEARTWMRTSFGHPSLDQIIIGIHFENMPETQKDKLSKGISKRIHQLQSNNRKRHLAHFLKFAKTYALQALVYLACTITCFGLLWWMSRPTDNYSAERGSPWGQRFKSLNWQHFMQGNPDNQLPFNEQNKKTKKSD